MATRTLSSLALAALLSVGLVACSASPAGSDTGTQADTSISDAPAATTEAVDLTGEWEQSNTAGGGSRQIATIVGETMSIYWVSDDETKSLFWAGSVEVAPDAGESFSWESANDTSQTASALLASSEDAKTMTYEGGTISYEVSALGSSWTVELQQTSTTPSAAPSTETAADSDFAVTIEGSSFANDYEGKPVIVVTFGFTNNSDQAENFMFSINAQAFQGGIELDDMAIGVDGVDSSLSMADIQPGVTVSVQQSFLLRDDSTVSVEVRELITFNDALLASQEFSVSS